jgi:hypothetical protein
MGFPFDSTRRRFLGPRRLAPEKKGLAAEIRETICRLPETQKRRGNRYSAQNGSLAGVYMRGARKGQARLKQMVGVIVRPPDGRRHP